MLIPTSLITIDSSKGHSAVRYEPAYYADLYKQVWGRASLAEGSPKVYDLPENADASVRYREVSDVNAEWRFLLARFKAKYVEAAFPGGETELRARIVALMAKDAERTKLLAAKQTEKPDPALLALGFNEEQARALTQRKITAAEAVELDVIALAELPDATPESAFRLQEKIKAKAAAAKAGVK